jgi:phosphate transport system substrate-binding protein
VKFKPPVSRRALRGLVLTGAAVASVSGLVLTQAPAMADPSITYLAAGSDTTQDVVNQFTVDLSGNLLGSFDAVNPVSAVGGEVITANKTGTGISGQRASTGITSNPANPENCSFTRPNGSGQGVNSLRQALGSTATIATAPGEVVTVTGGTPPVTATGPIPNFKPALACVDVARSSSGPATANVDPTAGNLIYIPFALDAVTASIGSTTNSIIPAGGTTPVATPATQLGALTTVGFDLAGLKTMYSTGNGAFPHGVTSGTCYIPFHYDGSAAGTAPAGCTTQVTVDLYVPQSGSGTRNFWLAQMYAPATAPASAGWWTANIVTAAQQPATTVPTAFQGQLVEEHNGTAVSADPIGIAPFSISQFISQKRGHNPRFFSAVLTPVDGTPPTVGAGTGTLNTAFPVKREVYNVLQYDRVVNTNPATGPNPFDANLAGLFVSTSSQLCQDAATVAAFGFGSLNTAPLGHHCGDIDTTLLRAFGPTTGF